MTSPAVALLLFQVKALKLPEPVTEHKFWPGRQFRFDVAWPDRLLALEVEGVVYSKVTGDHRLGGRHVSRKGFKSDLLKYGEAAALGWRVIRILPGWVQSGQAIGLVERALTDSHIDVRAVSVGVASSTFQVTNTMRRRMY